MRITLKKLRYFAAFLVACGLHASAYAVEAAKTPVPEIFRDPKPMLGQELTVTGVLRWVVENRNLFPVGTDPDHPPEPLCLPVLIKRSDTTMIKRAQALDAVTVIIKGRIVDPTAPGEMVIGMCKPVGIEVQSITPVGKGG